MGDFISNEKTFIDYLKKTFKTFMLNLILLLLKINITFKITNKPIFNQTTEKRMELKIHNNFDWITIQIFLKKELKIHNTLSKKK